MVSFITSAIIVLLIPGSMIILFEKKKKQLYIAYIRLFNYSKSFLMN